MPGSLALVGGDPFGATHGHHDAFLEAGTKVTLLPTAMAFENPAPHIDAARAHLEALGVSLEVVPVYTRADALERANAQKVAGAEVLYLTGGSPMHLRSVLVGTPLLEAGVAAWEGGTTVVAAAESNSVLCTHMVDNRGGAFTVGIGLITTLTAIGRFDHWSHDKWHRTVALAPRDLPVVGIDEATSLLRAADGTWSTHGSGEVHVFVNGSAATLDDLPDRLAG